MKQSVVWSRNKGKIDDEVYETHQTLMYGEMEDVKKMVQTKGIKRVRDIFIKKPSKVYTKPAFNLIAKFVLDVREKLDINKYVKSLY